MFSLKSLRTAIVLGVSLVVAGALVAAKPPPEKNKEQIVQKAKAAKLDETKAATADRKGKKIKFVATPAEVPDAELAKGAIIGKLTSDLPEDELGLAPGEYHLYLVKESEIWNLYAVAADGTVSAPAHITVEKAAKKHDKPEISFEETPQKPALSLAGSISIRLFGRELIGISWT